LLQDDHRRQLLEIGWVEVLVDDPNRACRVCDGPTHMQKSIRRHGATLSHGTFRVRETVRVCASGCRQEGVRAGCRSEALDVLIPPGSVVGYDVMVHVGLERFVRHQQREEIRDGLQREQGIVLSTGEISDLCRRFLLYLGALHRQKAPDLKAAMQKDGGWPLHIDATGEDGRGTLLVAYSGWRRWVLGAWKIPTERADAILLRLQETAALFGSPCAVERDLGKAITEAVSQFVENLPAPIPILACHQHLLKDVGKDLLREGHDKLRALFRRIDIGKDLRAFVRKLGKSLGEKIRAARVDVLAWQSKPDEELDLPRGTTGIAVVRALAQWILDYGADGNDEGFPYDLPYLDFFVRCLHGYWAACGFLRREPEDPTVKKHLVTLQKILARVDCDVPPFSQVARDLDKRQRLFRDLRAALRLGAKPNAKTKAAATAPPLQNPSEYQDIRAAIDKLTASLRERRPERGPAKDIRQAIDVVLEHLNRHGPYLWGHVIHLPGETGCIRLVDRTNNIIEGFFHGLKHGERRRSGRKILTQDFEGLPAQASLASNLTRPDYVEIVCGRIEDLPLAFSALDRGHRAHSLRARSRTAESDETETASMSSADRKLIRTDEMEQRILAAMS
jgi:hypothetical protein